MYNFDEIIDRRGTGAIKCDFLMEKYGRNDLIPMWIADMDFATPDFILDAIRQRMQHPVFGYFLARQDYYNVLSQWEKKMHDWDIDPSEIAFIPGIVKGIYFAIDCFTDKGDAVVVQPPVYMPFLSLPVCDGRKVLYNKLKLVNGLYEMDFENLEKIFNESAPKMMIISNPHNPGGRIWTKETLATLAALAKRYGVIVVSDEIHADMPLNGNCFTPFLAAGEDAEQVGIAFCAPSKTFNMAGIVSSFSVVKNSTLRERYYAFLAGNDLDLTMVFSTVATEAAYTKGETWRKECISYIQDNIKYVCDFLSANIRGIEAMQPQASFLIWLDCRGLGLSHDELVSFFVNEAKLALNDGETFGPGGEGFMRMNVASPRSVIEKAMIQLKTAVDNLNSSK